MKNHKRALSKEQVDKVVALYSSGKIKETIDEIKALNKDYPNVPLLFNLLGACYKTLGQLKLAVKAFESATALKPDYAEAYNNLGITELQIGDVASSVQRFKRAITEKPDYGEAHNNLGAAFNKLGQPEQSVQSYEKAVAINPNFAAAHNNLGNALRALGRPEESPKYYKEAIRANPNFAEAHNNLGNVYKDLGRLDKAAQSFKQAIAINPNFAEGHNNLGVALKELNQLDDALKCYKQAIAINPNFAEGHNNLGVALKELNQLDDALKCYKQAIAINPNFAEGHNNLGVALKELNQLDDALKCHKQAIAINPNYAEGHNNLGAVFKELNQLDDALKYYKQAIAINPNFAEAHYNCGNIFSSLNQFENALTCYEKAYLIMPNMPFLFGRILHVKMRLCSWTDFDASLIELTSKINNNERAIDPFSLLALIDDPETQMKCAKIFSKHHYPEKFSLPKIEPYAKRRKVRLGYFSGDFREHPVAALTAGLYSEHDRRKFEVHAFSYGPDTNDELNLRIKAGVDYFHDISRMSHKKAAILSRTMEIDIAIDLAGFTINARTEIFALKAAPVQISYIGYLGTMGASYYDYIIADKTLGTEINQNFFLEKMVYLPCYQVNEPYNRPPKALLKREDLGLPNKGFIFCCFNNVYKNQPKTFDSWCRILEKVEDSVLVVYANSDTAVKNLKKEISSRGISQKRLFIGGQLARQEYFARFLVADLFLDTYPFNAGTTASDALRAGLPILTRIGNSFNSREAASILSALDMSELVASSQDQYELIAVELAKDSKKLNSIKEKLIKNLSISPLYNTALFTRNIESAFLKIYDRSQRKLSPEHIYV